MKSQLLKQTNLGGQKTPLDTWALKTHQNVHLHSLSLIFLCKRKHLLGIQWLSVKLKGGGTDQCNEFQ